MSRRQLVELQIERLISPVGHKAEQETCNVKHWNGHPKHHDDPNHGDDLRVSVVKLNDLPCVQILVVFLQYLVGLFLITLASSVQALQRILSDPLTHGSHRSEPIDESSCENGDSYDTVPFSGEITIVTIEENAVESDRVQECHDQPIVTQVVIDQDQKDCSIEKLEDPHLGKCALDLLRDSMMSFKQR